MPVVGLDLDVTWAKSGAQNQILNRIAFIDFRLLPHCSVHVRPWLRVSWLLDMGPRKDAAMLKIEIVKQPDGVGMLRCTRRDGSVTWQKQKKHAAHFALHDLTHYAVEMSLGYRRGFFGLMAEGWDVDDTREKVCAALFRMRRLKWNALSAFLTPEVPVCSGLLKSSGITRASCRKRKSRRVAQTLRERVPR